MYHKRALEPYLKWIIKLLWNTSQNQIRVRGGLCCFHIHTYLLLQGFGGLDITEVFIMYSHCLYLQRSSRKVSVKALPHQVVRLKTVEA